MKTVFEGEITYEFEDLALAAYTTAAGDKLDLHISAHGEADIEFEVDDYGDRHWTVVAVRVFASGYARNGTMRVEALARIEKNDPLFALVSSALERNRRDFIEEKIDAAADEAGVVFRSHEAEESARCLAGAI